MIGLMTSTCLPDLHKLCTKCKETRNWVEDVPLQEPRGGGVREGYSLAWAIQDVQRYKIVHSNRFGMQFCVDLDILICK